MSSNSGRLTNRNNINTGSFVRGGANDEVFINTNVFDSLLDDLDATASTLKIDNSVFNHAEKANGTESMAELIAELKEVRNVSNYYKTHMKKGVIPLLQSVKTNIVEAANISSDMFRFK